MSFFFPLLSVSKSGVAAAVQRAQTRTSFAALKMLRFGENARGWPLSPQPRSQLSFAPNLPGSRLTTNERAWPGLTFAPRRDARRGRVHPG